MIIMDRRAVPGRASAIHPRHRVPPAPLALGAVALGFALAQLCVVTPSMPIGWDEAVYVSQFSREVPATEMIAARTPGVSLLTAPITLLTPSVAALRIYLAVLSGAGLFLAYLPWLKIRKGLRVPLAAGLFASLWLTIFYGTQAMPNLYIAYGAVAATALLLRVVRLTGAGLCVTGLAVTLGVVSSLRPTDGVWLAAPLAVAALLVPARRSIGPRIAALVPMGIGLAIGWGPWIVDSYARFGDPAERFEAIDRTSAGGLHFLLLRHVQAVGGALVCGEWRADCGPYPLQAVAWWVAMPVLVALGAWACRAADRHAVVLVLGVAMAMGLPYLVITGHANPRYLLPMYAMLALPAADGLIWLAGRMRARIGHAGPALAVGAVAVHLVGQLVSLHGLASQWRAQRGAERKVAAELARHGVKPPCMVYGDSGPPIAHTARCHALDPPYDERFTGQPARKANEALHNAQRRGWAAAVVAHTKAPPAFPAGWRPIRLRSVPGWYVLLPPL